MKIDVIDDDCLRLSQTHSLWRILLMLMSGGVCLSASADLFTLEGWQEQMEFAATVLAPLLIALWLQDSVWTFDCLRQRAFWKRSWLLWESSGSMAFDRVRRVVIQVCENSEEYARDRHAYRVALGLLGEELPITQNYGERQQAERVAAVVREVLGVREFV